MKTISLDQFYQRFAAAADTSPQALLPPDGERQTGHFNFFDIAEQFAHYPPIPVMP